MFMASCTGSAQPNLSNLSDAQWQEDFNFLVARINKSFAGFTPEIREAFDRESQRLGNELNSLPPREKILGMAKLMALLHDGHTEISLVGRSSQFHRYPVSLYYFGDSLHIVAINEANKEHVGSLVTAFNDVPTAEVFEKIKPYINRDNDIEYITTIPEFMTLPEMLYSLKITDNPDELTMTLRKNGNYSKIKLNAVTLQEFNDQRRVRAFEKPPLYLENTQQVNWYRFFAEDGTLYVNIRSLFNPDNEPSVRKLIQGAFKEFDKQNGKRLVIDLRSCRGGNYHNGEPILEEIKKRTTLQQPNRVFVLNSRLTFSAASVLTLFMKEKAGALIVGEISRARPNWAENAESYVLPNSRLKFDCLDETRMHSPTLGKAQFIPVDHEIKRTFESYLQGRDEVMEYIFSLPK